MFQGQILKGHGTCKIIKQVISGTQELIKLWKRMNENRYLHKKFLYLWINWPFLSNIAGRVLPTVSPEGGPQQIGEIKDYL